MKEQPTPNLERLMLLSVLLREIHRDESGERPAFNLSTWSSLMTAEEGTTAIERLRSSSNRELRDGFCGTVACAVGSAALDPRFIACGLTLHTTENGTVWPMYEEETGWSAVCAFFGLNSWEADMLFNQEAYRLGAGTPADHVNRRLCTFINVKREEIKPTT